MSICRGSSRAGEIVIRVPRLPVLAYPTLCATLGDHLRKARSEKGLSQRELAHLLGVDVTTVTGWEGGHHTPPVPQRGQIIQFLGFDPLSEALTTYGQRIVA